MKVVWKLFQFNYAKQTYFRVQIRIGDIDLADPKDDEDVKILEVIDVKIHPNFKKNTVYFDVAVLTTEPINIEPGNTF